MLKFLICPATTDQITDGGYDLFKGQDGATYNYQVEYFEDDMVTIRDSVGRYVPLDVAELKALINMLARIDTYQKNKLRAQEALVEELLRGASRG